jgi:uncharacterized protein YggE
MRHSIIALLAVMMLAVLPAAHADMGRTVTLVQGTSQPVSAREGARRVIEVTGFATVSAKPDDMIVSFSVTSRARTADECTREQSAKTNKIVDALKAKAGTGAQVHTADFTMSPYNVPIAGAATPTPGEPAQTWIFTADVTAYADSLATISKVIDAGMAAGATGVGGSGFDVEPGQAALPSGATAGVFRNQTYLSGSGRPVYVRPPEKPFIAMRVQLKCAGASECVRRGARIVDRVRRAMIDSLGDKNAVQLSNFQLNELPNQQRYGYQPPQQYQTRQDFQAHATASVETRDLHKLGELIEAGIRAGADQLNSVQFTLRADAAARNQAIAQAAEDAKGKAAVLAKSMGVQLGDVIRISTNAAVQPRTIYGASLSQSISVMTARAMPVQPRNVGFTAQVNVTYAIK